MRLLRCSRKLAAMGGVLLLALLALNILFHPLGAPERTAVDVLDMPCSSQLQAAPKATLSHSRGPEEEPRPDHACRFWGMVGNSPPESTLTDQLVTGTYSMMLLGDGNRDGWGIAYAAQILAGAGLERLQTLRGGPQANHEFDHRFEDAVTEMIALDAHIATVHVRSASSGHTGIPNPHPFSREGLTLVHNGTFLSNTLVSLLEEGNPKYLDEHPPDYKNPYVDSELFLLYVLKIREQGVDNGDGRLSYAMQDVLSAAALNAHDAGAIGTAANCLITVGDTLLALRFDRTDQARYKVRYLKIPNAWVVASEPVGTDTTGWMALPPKSLGVFTAVGAPEIITVFPPEGAWISLFETTVDDDMQGQSAGNGDGDIDAGELIELIPVLHNEGGMAATEVSAVLRVAEDECVILDSTAVYPDLMPGDKAGPLTPFVLQISSQLDLHSQLNFTLEITANSGMEPQVWVRTCRMFTGTPVIVYHDEFVDDGQNGHLDPGEEADILIYLQNQGTEFATSLLGTLSSLSPHVEILQNQSALDTLAIWQIDSLTPPARISVFPSCPTPDILTFRYDVEADWGITECMQLELPVGGFFDHMEGGQGEWTHEPGMPGYGDAWHLSSLQNHTAGGYYAWKCGSPDSGAVYPDLLDAALITPEVALSLHTELHFWHWIHAELASGHFGHARDGGLIEASINGGPWQQLYPDTGYDYLIEVGLPPGPFPADTPVFSGWSPWRHVVVQINGFEGTVRFRFRFGSDGNIGGEGLEGWYIDDVEIIGTNQTSDAPESRQLPLRPALTVGGPSPFRDQTTILYDVARSGAIQLSILDLEGRVVRHLAGGAKSAGRYRIVWDGRDQAGRPVSSGLYFYRLRSRADDFEDVRRVIRLR
ncbi:MAG: class II glutamine amidotransferase [Candidatus Eisenbacteria sp.]|nr:class II glutamine amidotransferase [Candidatus Eisenbacteria bacterium]